MPNIYKASTVTMADIAVRIDSGEGLESHNTEQEVLKTSKKNGTLKSPGKKSKDDLLEEAQNEAEMIILKARNEAQLIKDNTAGEMQKLRAETEELAHKQGYNDGFNKGSLEAEKLMEQARETLRDAREKRDDILREIEPQAVVLISKILGKLLVGAVKMNPQIILYLIREGLSQTAGSEAIKIHVSQQDFDFVHKHLSELAIHSPSQNIELIKDAALKSMDCIIETSYGNIDSSLDQKFESLKKDLHYMLNSGSV